MRIGVITDIHANLSALEAVLAALEGVDVIVCLGDIVGYGPDPVECVRAVRAACPKAIRGNHDEAVRDLSVADSFNAAGQAAVRWQKAVIDEQPDVGVYLDALPESDVFGGVRLAHGSPALATEYILDRHRAAFGFRGMPEQIGLFGHTHLPACYRLSEGDPLPACLRVQPGKPLPLDPSTRHLLNPGSVGQPRDGDPRAAYGVLDTDAMTFTSHRKPYDIATTTRRILARGLPRILADRLEVGR